MRRFFEDQLLQPEQLDRLITSSSMVFGCFVMSNMYRLYNNDELLDLSTLNAPLLMLVVTFGVGMALLPRHEREEQQEQQPQMRH